MNWNLITFISQVSDLYIMMITLSGKVGTIDATNSGDNNNRDKVNVRLMQPARALTDTFKWMSMFIIQYTTSAI